MLGFNHFVAQSRTIRYEYLKALFALFLLYGGWRYLFTGG